MNNLFGNIGSCLKIIFHFEKKHTILFLLALVLLSVLSPLRLLAVGRFVDAAAGFIGGGESRPALVLWCGLLLSCLLASAALTFFSKSREIKIKERLYGDFSKGILDKVTGLEYSFFENPETYDTIQRMGEDPQEQLLSTFVTIVSLISGFAAVAAYTVIFVRISILFALIGLLALAAIIFFNNHAMKMMNNLYEEQTFDERMQDYYGKILSDKRSLFELKTYNAVDYIIAKRTAIAARITTDRRKRTVQSQFAVGYASLSIVLWLTAVTAYLTFTVIRGNISIGVFVSLLGSAGSILACFDSLSRDFSGLLRTSRRVKYYTRRVRRQAVPSWIPCGNR
jgi:ABC-type multidrug transport system fused ATPase/permease subunit